MWDSRAAGCLAGQLSGFISSHGITDLVVITHSNGGNVIRWILSNPTYDSRYPGIISRIRWVRFYDTARTLGREPLSHNQSRRACFGLETIRRRDL